MYPLPISLDVYDKTYFSGADKGFGYVDYDLDKQPMIPVFKKYLEIISSLGIKKGKLLDVGCATGFFMNIAKDFGFEVYGVEMSDFAAQKGRDAGLNIITGPLEGSNYPDSHFDVITMCDVLEHVSSPKDVLAEAKRILKKGGVLMVNTPDSESLWSRLFGSRWHLILPPEHLHYFSPFTLNYYLSNHGFKTMINTKIGKLFTFQYIFIMLYKWQGLKIWQTMSSFFSKGYFSRFFIPINLYDNFFMILKKTDEQ
ncbi:class I SAM-dependent methyltransferase [Patescibacteria group bacterium]|nr:class I SAM-dependent methyltransferase [Patescibacteria group bacterium]